MRFRSWTVLPGFGPTLGFSLLYLGLMVLLAGICGVFFGRLVDRLGKSKLLLVALVISAKGRAAGMQRTKTFEPPTA